MKKPEFPCLRISQALFLALTITPASLFIDGRCAVHAEERRWCEIQVLDAATERGVPLVELETVNGLRFVTDNAGRVALNEPGWMGREIHFTLRSHGYEIASDGFGFAGVKITPDPARPAVVRVVRRNIAERLGRLTGEGLYRDTILLGHLPAAAENPGRVAGQDSVQAAILRDRVYWFWGDTARLAYPLGMFRTAGATTPVPDPLAPAADPARGLAFQYFVDPTGFARAMMPLPERPEGVIWVSGVCVVPDRAGKEHLLAHYSRRRGLAGELEQGIAVFNEEKAIFEVARQLPLTETWRRPAGHPVLFTEGDRRWLLFGSPNPNVRVNAIYEDVLDPARYEAFTCARRNDQMKLIPAFKNDGDPHWQWQQELPPVDSQQERAWVKQDLLSPGQTRFFPAAADAPEKRVQLHSGTVRWNAYRRCWILIACQIEGDRSFLGEIWYAEAAHPEGPFRQAVKIATHERQSLYNVCHHAFLDREGGRLIHFEGTYTNDFSNNPEKTPRYQYNQLLYRLDLADPRLRPAQIAK